MSAQEIFSTHDCSVPGCPDEAREAGGVCRYHQSTSDRPRSVAPGSHAHLMKEPPVNACKMPGCTNPSAGKGGPWADTCQQHISAEIARRQAKRHAKPAALPVSPPQPEAKKPKPAARPTPPQPKPKAETCLRIAPTITTGSLVQLAQTVEDREAAVAAAREQHAQAVQALRDALDAA